VLGNTRKLALAGLVSAAFIVVLPAAGAPSSQARLSVRPSPYLTPPGKHNLNSITWDLPRGGPTSLDPILAFGSQNAPVVTNLCDSVLRVNPDGTISPGLASWGPKNRREWQFNLRGNPKFWDGTPVTAADVAFSLQRSATDPTSTWRSQLSNVLGVTAVGTNKVVVSLKNPDALFPKIVAGGAGAVISRAFYQSQGTNFGTPTGGIMCSGPFELKSWTPGQSLSIARNPNYWDPTHAAHVGEIDFSFITDPTTLTNALNSGEIDGTYFVPLAAIPTLKTSSAGKLYFGPPNASGNLFIFHNDPSVSALGDPRVRQALRYALDYGGIVGGIFQGAGVPLRASGVPTSWTYGKAVYAAAWKDIAPAKQDLTKAKALIAQANPSNKNVVCAAPALTPEFIQVCEAVQSAANSIGLNGQVQLIPQQQYSSLTLPQNTASRNGIDMDFAEVPFYVTDPLNMYQVEAAPNGQFNIMQYNDPSVTRLLQKAEGNTNDNARASLVTQAQAKITNALPWIPVFAPDQLLFMNKSITGAALSIAQWYPWAVGIGSAT
jgi:peptide/nickel transport system substrate-binding protein